MKRRWIVAPALIVVAALAAQLVVDSSRIKYPLLAALNAFDQLTFADVFFAVWAVVGVTVAVRLLLKRPDQSAIEYFDDGRR